MNRRALYALGEPLGNGATRARPGGGWMCGDGGDSSSSQQSNTSSTTTSIDKRQVVSDKAIGITSDSSTVNLNVLDGDIAKASLEFATVSANNSLTSFEKVLGTSATLIDKLLASNAKNQSLAQTAIESYTPASSGGVEKAKSADLVKVAFIAGGALVLAKSLGSNK